jgi:plastocyanin
MNLIRALIVAAALALAATAAATPMAPPRLIGTVGPGFTISLKQNARLVKTQKAGRHTFVVTDKSSIHSFHLKGPGLSRVITGIGFSGTKTVTLTLKKGRYTYVCDVHPTMIGHFTVL